MELSSSFGFLLTPTKKEPLKKDTPTDVAAVHRTVLSVRRPRSGQSFASSCNPANDFGPVSLPLPLHISVFGTATAL